MEEPLFANETKDVVPKEESPPDEVRCDEQVPPLPRPSLPKPRYHIGSLTGERVFKAKKRPFPSETGETVISSWEAAAGARNALDIMQIDTEGEAAYAASEDEENEMPPPEIQKPPCLDIPLWEKAAGAQNAVDIMQFGAENEPVAEEAVSGDQRKMPSVRLQKQVDPFFVGPLLYSSHCPMCPAEFYVAAALQKHVEAEHPGADPLWCHLCPWKFKNLRSYWSHLRWKHSVLPTENHPAGYECPECFAHFTQRDDYAFHCQNYKGRPHFYCKLCHEFGWLDHFEAHNNMVSHRGKICLREVTKKDEVFTCKDCGKQVGTWEKYTAHRKTVQTKPHTYCQPCGKVCAPDEWLEHQKQKGHRGGRVQFYCCGVVRHPKELEKHLQSKWHLDKSKAEMGTLENKRPLIWKCPSEVCGAVFASNGLLVQHMAMHPGLLPFPCRHCPRQFWIDVARNKHEEIEHAVRL